MVAMRFIRKLGSRRAIPRLEKLLTSENADERDYALATLEELAGGDQSGGNSLAETSNENMHDSIVMRNGNRVTGQIQDKSLTLKTSYAELRFTMDKIALVSMEGGGSEVDKLELRNGDKLSGTIKNESFTVKLESGSTAVFKKRDVASIAFRRMWKK